MERSEFCKQVLSRVRHATAEERAAIQAELEGHLEDHALALTEAGYPEDEAADRALAAMGDPAEIGQALNQEYPLRWLVLSRAAVIATALLCCTVLFSFPLLQFPLYNLQARIAPKTSPFVSTIGEGVAATKALNLRVSIGDDVLYVYQVGLQKTEAETVRVYLFMCNYDRNPFGTASGWLLGRLQCEDSMEWDSRAVHGGGGSRGAYYARTDGIPVPREQEYLHLTYDAFGEQADIWVPLPWEVLA